MSTYAEFLARKAQYGADDGFAPSWIPDCLFPVQAFLTDWAIRKGRAAILADCGLGKTLMELVWAENVVRNLNRPVLILAPLAVAQQTVREGEKFGIEVLRIGGGTPSKPGIYVTNYEKLHLFDPVDWGGCVCDESSAIKAFDGKRRAMVTEFLRTLPYRLLATATPAPNDYIELGTSSEALGVMGQMDMLNRFFRNDNNTSDTKSRWKGYGAPRLLSAPGWRFKGHAEVPFMKWVCWWARACRRPSDLGYEDGKFVLPELIEREHIIEARTLADELLFPLAATNMAEEREECRRTLAERCEYAAELVAHTRQPFVIWCQLNPEGEMLGRLLKGQAIEISGSDSDEAKEAAYEAFSLGQVRGLISKQKIAGWGLNWQHCAHVVEFVTHSYEQHYQGVRRCWRFGQNRPVLNDIIATKGQERVKDNMRRKAEAADKMFTALVTHMNDAMRIDNTYRFDTHPEVPAWMAS